MDDIQRIKNIISKPDYPKNQKKSIKKLVVFLDFKYLTILVCSFIERIVDILEEYQPESYHKEYIKKLKQFVMDEISLEHIINFTNQTSIIHDENTALSYYHTDKFQAWIMALSAFFSIKYFCFIDDGQRKENNFKIAGLFSEIVDEINRAVYRKAAGNDNLISNNPTTVKEAKVRGKEAANKEFRWQLDQIYKVFKESYDIDVWAMEKELENKHHE